MADSSTPSQKSRRYTPIFLFLIPSLAIILASFMYFTNTMVPEGRSNKGTLVVPTLLMDKLDLQLQQNADADAEGKWELIVFGENDCVSKECQEMLYNARQVNVALGRDKGRVVHRYVNINDVISTKALASFQNKYPRLQLSHTSYSALQVFLDKVVDADKVIKGNYIFVADPLGNVMMYYTPQNTGNDILDDLKKLLKVSNIG